MKKKGHTHKQFKISAARCNLQDGDNVFPDTIIGEDWETGDPVEAGCQGRVESINFSGGDHALIVTIATESSDEKLT